MSLQSQVEDDSYQETYQVLLTYQHVFSLLYEDGSSVDTSLVQRRTLATPPVCRTPFTSDRESTSQEVSRRRS